ncbi:hypothetical protein [Halalkalibacter akibai]|nr:hypothetical protein [Halalkalibacter akibai]
MAISLLLSSLVIMAVFLLIEQIITLLNGEHSFILTSTLIGGCYD